MGFIPFPRVIVLCEMQSVSSRIWTCVTMSISYDDNHYTTGTSKSIVYIYIYIYADIQVCSHQSISVRDVPCTIVANLLECNIVVSKFKPRLCNYLHFWTYGKGMNHIVLPSNRWNSITAVLFYKYDFDI